MKTASKSLTAIAALFFSVVSYAQIPIYNSYPSAAATIFLDFDGQYVDGTSWNYNGPITCGPSNMTNAQINEIFNRISEDYRPFNVNITTDSTKYWAAPPMQRIRVILTITSDWYGAAGGVSYVGSFTWGDNTPSFVFTALLGYNTKYIAEATSHEIGHTLGLSHQSTYDVNCSKTAEYNPGTGSGEIGWAPIMGVGYYRNFTLWHNGTNPWGCSYYQDDLSILTTYNGFDYRTDDNSNNADATATRVNFMNNRFSADGVIEKIDDKDVFTFTMPEQGKFHLDANPFSISGGDNGSNLDMQVELLNSAKNVVGSYNPELLLNATIDTTLLPGTYYVRVQSMGNIYAPDYASLGSYNITAVITPTTVLPLHLLEFHGNSENNIHNFNWTIVADETITQQVLEVSSNGRDFQSLSKMNADARTYTYLPMNSGVLYYRLRVTFNNNKQYFSNIVVLQNKISKPEIVTNPVHNSIQIKSPSAFKYAIVDFSGRALMKGNLVQGVNTIATDGLTNGMYIIQYNNGQKDYAEKFMKQ